MNSADVLSSPSYVPNYGASTSTPIHPTDTIEECNEGMHKIWVCLLRSSFGLKRRAMTIKLWDSCMRETGKGGKRLLMQDLGGRQVCAQFIISLQMYSALPKFNGGLTTILPCTMYNLYLT